MNNKGLKTNTTLSEITYEAKAIEPTEEENVKLREQVQEHINALKALPLIEHYKDSDFKTLTARLYYVSGLKSVADLARWLGLPYGTIYKYTRHGLNDFELLTKLHNEFDLNTNWVLFGSMPIFESQIQDATKNFVKQQGAMLPTEENEENDKAIMQFKRVSKIMEHPYKVSFSPDGEIEITVSPSPEGKEEKRTHKVPIVN